MNPEGNFEMSKPFVPSQDENGNLVVNLEDVPDDCKETIKCDECGETLFKQYTEWYKIKLNNNIAYANTVVSICVKCGWRLPDKP